MVDSVDRTFRGLTPEKVPLVKRADSVHPDEQKPDSKDSSWKKEKVKKRPPKYDASGKKEQSEDGEHFIDVDV